MRLKWLVYPLAGILLYTSIAPVSFAAQEQLPAEMSVYDRLPFYSEISSTYPAEYPAEPLEIPLSQGIPSGNAPQRITGMQGISDYGIKWDPEVGDLSWLTEVPESGQYTIKIGYQVLGASGNNAVRSLLIDGEIPFYEAEKIVFYRQWEDKGDIIKNNINDEVRPGVIEKKGWQTCTLRDSYGYYASPLVFYLTAGEHRLTLNYISQDMELDHIVLEPYRPAESYQSVSASYDAPESGNLLQIYQAETSMDVKNDATIRIESNGDPETVPISYGERVFNTVGGYRWRKGSQSVTFQIEVPKDGYYQLGFRFNQVWNDGIPSYRRIEIDGEVPFSELAAYRFDYDGNWQTEILGSDGEPYLFYLKKGVRALTMTVMMGDLTPVIQSLYDDIVLISSFTQDINKLTGSNPDPNYDYQFFRYIPTLKSDMQKLVESLRIKSEQMGEISEKSTSMESNFKSIIKQMESMIQNPFSIAKRINQIHQAQTSLGAWHLELQNQPLQLDEIILASPGMRVSGRQSNLIQKLRSAFKSFLLSFIRDYTNMASILDENVQVKGSIDVWLSRGTEWAEIMKEMADESFTPQTGIYVNLNIVPSTQLNTGSANALLLSIISGSAPDLAMGVAANSPVEFAIRDAVLDFSRFPDFHEIKERFLPDIFVPFKYRGGIYGIPETMNFTCLFYRKDILSKIGAEIPDTREQLYHDVLPVLYQNGLSYFQSRDFTQFLFQHGGEFYREDGTKSALDTPEAYKAFLEFTQMYTNYSSPVNANFFNRFRTGEMPLGIGDYGLYLQLSTAAPELAGKWGVAPLPGIQQPDGDVNRSCGGLASECIVLLDGKGDGNVEAASWEFVKWWTSFAVQQDYSREIEALIGVESRWNSANVEAFEALEWEENDREVFREQFAWATETPVVLGGYFSSRYITNAFTSAVISLDKNPRDALEDAVKAINRELKQKQDEYRGIRQ